MFKLIFSLAIWASLLPSGYEISGRVTKVIDGNTLEIITHEMEVIQIMLDQIDCPEPGQQFADEAHRFTEKLALKKKVTVQISQKDRWGNKLSMVKIKKICLNKALVKEGLAWATEKGGPEMKTYEQEARQAKKGLWNQEAPVAPWVYRRNQTMLTPKGR